MFSLAQLQQGRNNKPIWIQIVSQFMKPFIFHYEKDIQPGTTNFEEYCPVSGEALLFLLLENNYDRWIDEYARKGKSKEEKDQLPALSSYKFSGTVVANGRAFGGWENSTKIRFNEYVDIVQKFNKKREKVDAYNNALKKACNELIAKKKKPKSKKRKSPTQEIDTTRLKFTLPAGMTM